MKVCIFVVGIITLLFGVFGVFVPWTLSADSTSLNILGGLVILFTILFMCWFLPAELYIPFEGKVKWYMSYAGDPRKEVGEPKYWRKKK